MRYRFGIGKSDITGPCVGLGFMGMSRCAQTGKGIHTRLYSRAFVVEDADGKNAVAIVCADLGICSLALKAAVVKKLAELGPREDNGRPRFRAENVMITANHTHSGPGGYSHLLMYNFSIRGFNSQNFRIIVDGITASILAALKAMTTGTIVLAAGDLPECGWIRSKQAYIQNPEVALPPIPKDDRLEPCYQRMILLKFVDDNNTPRGTINWFALHPTNMGERNQMISGDNKGYAEQCQERDKGDKGLIAAFANSCCGDISPNVGYGVPLGKYDVVNTKEFGERQFKRAQELFNNGGDELSGPIDYRHKYIDLSDYRIDGQGRVTWPAALGFGMLNGSQEDSRGLGLKEDVEGTTRSNFSEKIGDLESIIKTFRGLADFLTPLDWPKNLDPAFVDGHGDKKIFLPVGLMDYRGLPVAPSILPVQLLRLGGLLLIGHPGELTTVAGLRLREKIASILSPSEGVAHVEVAAYANAYSSYTTTPEEYAAQHYEGASNLFGPGSLLAYRDAFSILAEDMRTSQHSSTLPAPRPLDERRLVRKSTHVSSPDFGEPGYPLGKVTDQVRPFYRKGETVEFSFIAGHPNRDPANAAPKPGWPVDFRNTFFIIVPKGGESDPKTWIGDDHFQTKLLYGRFGRAVRLTVQWLISDDQNSGIFRIVYAGLAKTQAGGAEGVFLVTSAEFAVA